MAHYFCEHCNYRFEVKEGKPVPNRCSYCGKEGGIKQVKTAQDWLNEVGSED